MSGANRGERQLLPGRIPPAEMFPAGDARFRVRWLETATGDRVRTVESGPEDGKAVVLLPGWGCPAYVFRELLPALGAQGYRAIAAEPRGHGLSDRPTDPGAYSTDALTAHVEEILDLLRLDGFVLGGHSMGAALAARAAARLAPRLAPRTGGGLRGLILLSPVGTHGQPRKLLARLLTPRFLTKLSPRLVTRTVVRIVLRMAASRNRVFTKNDIGEYWASSQFPGFLPALLHLLREFDWGDRSPVDISEVSVPTLLVYGTRDPLVRRTGVVEKLRNAGNVRVVTMPGVGHVITDEAPEVVNGAVIEFLESLPADVSSSVSC